MTFGVGGAFEIFRQPITLQRLSAGSYVNGLWVEGTITTSIITASIQPMSGEELQSLPEERRVKKNYKLFTASQLLTVQNPTKNPDRVIIFGELYEVYQVFPWLNNIISHYEAYVSKVDTDI